METFKPTSQIRRRVAVMLAGACLIVPASAVSPKDGRKTAEQEYSRRIAAAQEAQELLLNGDEAYKAGKYSEAMEAFAGAREMLPDAPVSSELRTAATERYAQACVEQARVLSRNGDVAGAKTVVDNALRDGVAPNHPGALAFRAQLDDPIRTNPALTPEHTKDIDSVRRLLYTAEGAFNLGKLNEAKANYEKVLRIDPTNTAARRGLEQVATGKSQYQKSAYDHTRAEILGQVDAAWETTLTPTDIGPIPLDPDVPGSTAPSMTVTSKLDRIIIPKVQLDQATLQEALNFLRSKAAECDTIELDPTRKGVNFNLNLGPADAAVTKRILSEKIDLKLNGLPLSKVLRYLTELTYTSYTTDDFSVIISPLGSSSEELISRTYRVPPDFITSLSSGGGAEPAAEDPFASDTPKKGLLTTRLTAKEALSKQGISFPEGANASYLAANNTLRVTNTARNQDIISQLVDTMTHTEPVLISVQVTMIKAQRTVLEELGFDTLITPVPLNADGSLFASGGAVGNGSPRTGGDFVSPVGGVPLPGVPVNPTAIANPGVVTNGLRSGDFAIKNNELDGIVNNIDRTTQTSKVAPGILAITGLFTDGQVQTMMRGLDQKKGVDIMARPSTVTRSGQQASISIVREFIYPTEYDPPQIPSTVNGGGGGGIGGGIGGGGGGSAPVTPATPTAFEKRDVGVMLEILPVADADKKFVDITLNPQFTDFDGFVNYGTPINSIQTNLLGGSEVVELTKNAILMPVFSAQRLNTQLTVLDGSTIVIGGLMSDTVQKVEDKVPVLGDIPLLGRFFRSEAQKPITTAIIFLVHLELIDPTGRPYRDR